MITLEFFTWKSEHLPSLPLTPPRQSGVPDSSTAFLGPGEHDQHPPPPPPPPQQRESQEQDAKCYSRQLQESQEVPGITESLASAVARSEGAQGTMST